MASYLLSHELDSLARAVADDDNTTNPRRWLSKHTLIDPVGIPRKDPYFQLLQDYREMRKAALRLLK